MPDTATRPLSTARLPIDAGLQTADLRSMMAAGDIAGTIALADRCVDMMERGEIECSEAVFVMRGRARYRTGDRQGAMEDFMAAIDINPDSEAAAELEMIHSILDFYHKDVYGQ